MKKILIAFLLLVFKTDVNAQSLEDSLRSIIAQNRRDTTEVEALLNLSNQLTDLDSAIAHAEEALSLAEKLEFKKGRADCFLILGDKFGFSINFGEAIQYGLNALSIYEEIRDNVGIASAHGLLQGLYRLAGDHRKSLDHAFQCLQVTEANHVIGKYFLPGHSFVPAMLAEIAQTYVLMNELDSASYFTQKAIQVKETYHGSEWNFPVYLLATIQTVQGNYALALTNYRKAVPLAIKNEFFRDTLQIFSGMSTLFKKTAQLDSAIHYAKIVASSSNPQLEIKNLLEAVANLAEVYKMNGNKDSAIKYIELSHALRDSIFSSDRDREVQAVTFNEERKQQQLIASQLKFKSKVQLYVMSGGILIMLLIAGILWRNNTHKQKAKEKIEQAYRDLKVTQAQLIQSEKMASLGELTAGIAHEIQNPLNFVNNFSEVNAELIEELKGERSKKGERNEQSEDEILDNLKHNTEKIVHHGKRADAIVRGMLQHSRTSSGQKEPTDVNALCDEYLRLAYHGFRARDKSFNADIKTDFDNSVGKINVVSQDIGRVVLNLINNAFYAVNEKQKENIAGYEPTVAIVTKKTGQKVVISVKDNGNGIPQKVLDKIFQPFFTTKPTGQGTGLGLSLAYDIIKAHDGEIKLETKEGEGSEFVIQLRS
jgi:signal transduction histidine kinase